MAISSEDTAHNGTNYTLTCAVTVDPAVDTELQVTRTWRKGSAVVTDTTPETTIAQSNDGNVYTSSLTFEPLDSGDEDQYTCQAEVEPTPTNTAINGNTSAESSQLRVLGECSMCVYSEVNMF